MRCHNVFYVSLLRAFVASEREQPPPKPMAITPAGEAMWEVEALVGHKPRTAASHEHVRVYDVKWSGYPVWENTEEPAGNIMRDAPECVREYWERRPVAHGARPSRITAPQPPAAPAPPAPTQAPCRSVRQRKGS
jgi:hypothetical protein